MTDSAKMKSKSGGFRWYSVDYIVRFDLAKEKELHLGTLTESAKKKSSCFEKKMKKSPPPCSNESEKSIPLPQIRLIVI